MGGRPQGSPLRMGCRGGRPCPPGPDNATPCRAGPVCPAVGAGKIRFGPSRTPAPTKRFVGEGLCPSRGRPQGSPLRKRNKRRDERATARVAPTKAQQEVQWAGDRKGRPYESATRGVMGGRPQGSPLRKRYKRRDERATARVAPTEGYKKCGGVRNPPFLRPFKIIFFRCSYPCNECVFPVIDRIICLERRTIP